MTQVDDLCVKECRDKLVTKTFADDNKVILTFPPNPDNPDQVANLQIVSDLKNTFGQMNCISKDTTKCVLDNVSMLDGEDGNFGANFDDPKAIVEEIS